MIPMLQLCMKTYKRDENYQTKKYLHDQANYIMYMQKLRFTQESQLKQVNKCQLFTQNYYNLELMKLSLT